MVCKYRQPNKSLQRTHPRALASAQSLRCAAELRRWVAPGARVPETACGTPHLFVSKSYRYTCFAFYPVMIFRRHWPRWARMHVLPKCLATPLASRRLLAILRVALALVHYKAGQAVCQASLFGLRALYNPESFQRGFGPSGRCAQSSRFTKPDFPQSELCWQF